MGEFKRSGGFGGNKNRGGFGGGSGGRPSFGNNRPAFGNRDDRGRSEMFTATCDSCHKQCEVPFRPTGSKPVYCNNCFSAKKEERDGGYSSKENPKQYPDRKHDLSFDGPPKPKAEDKRIDELKIQLNALNAKVDTLLRLMQTNTTPVVRTEVLTTPVHVTSTKTTVPTNKPKPVVKKVTPAATPVKKVATKLSAKKKVVAKKK